MKALFIGIVSIHGLVHLMGFVKAFDLAKISQFTLIISKPIGILWLISAFLFLSISILFFLNKDWWWIPALLAVILSQILIIRYWPDAKYGTIPNLIILFGLVIGFAFWNFNAQVNQEIKEILVEKTFEEKIITEETIKDLPVPVQRWLKNSGVIGKEKIHTVYLKQKGFMKLKPDQKDWIKSEADEYFTIDQPVFIWRVKTSMMGLPVVGRDLFRDGQGKMQIKLAGIIPVVNVANNPKLNESALQRYLGEIIWFPTAAVSSYIKWEPVNDYSAKATMSYGGTTGSAVFYFNEQGELTKFVALRYKDITDEKPTEWVATVKGTETLNDLKLPTKLEASWVLDNGEFTWYKFEISDVEYNDITQ
ncbi:MAG: hypothetical protein GX295_07335 [Syntrophomonadaceae bacterium]|nr:hypothetical protein [Syntrophomonadaceae bacterium]